MRSELISGFTHHCSPNSKKLPDTALNKYLLNENVYFKSQHFRFLSCKNKMNYEIHHGLWVEYSPTNAYLLTFFRQTITTEQIKSLTTKIPTKLKVFQLSKCPQVTDPDMLSAAILAGLGQVCHLQEMLFVGKQW